MRPAALPSSDVRGRLRAATTAVHERLHEAPAFVAIAEQRLGLPAYADLLSKTAAFHLTIGAELGLDPQRRDRLGDDLDALGAAVPLPLSWRAPQSPAARLGCAYVAEGSAIGGKVIYRQLDYLFGDSALGRSFYQGSPSDSSRWRSLCSDLEAAGEEPSAVGEMIAGANETFRLFENILDRVRLHD